jgi:hypothetical protein
MISSSPAISACAVWVYFGSRPYKAERTGELDVYVIWVDDLCRNFAYRHILARGSGRERQLGRRTFMVIQYEVLVT